MSTGRLARVLALPALAVGLLAVAGPDAPLVEVPLRVHVLESAERALDASRLIGESEVRANVLQIDRIFAPARVAFDVDVVVERPATDEAFRRASVARKRAGVLATLVSPPTRRSPAGFDLYLARDLTSVGVGGAYLCTTDRQRGHGAAFIGVEGPSGRPLAVRKWAHELGHALGLRHTPCEPHLGDRLMMSGRCEHGSPDRVGLSDEEIARVRKQALAGGPAPCGTLEAPDEDQAD